MRLGGASVRASIARGAQGRREERPLGRGTGFAPQVDVATARARVLQATPAARIAWGKPLYILPDSEDEAVIEPQVVFSVASSRRIEGQEVISRRGLIAHSMRDARAPLVDLSEQETEETEGDPRSEE